VIARSFRAALLSTLALCTAGVAAAQTGEAPPAPPQAPRGARETDTPADRFGFVDGQQLQIATGTDDDKLTFRMALPTNPSVPTRFSLAVSTPLEGGDDAMPASLDALANGTRVTLSVGYFDLRIGRPSEAAAERRAEARRRCREAPAEAATVNTPQDNCRRASYALQHYDPGGLAFDRRDMPGATDYGLDATVGINDFEWIEAATMLPQQERRTDWSVAANVTHWLPRSQTALTGSVSYQRAYEAAEEQQVCPPNSTDPADCVTTRTAAPTVNENLLVSAGLRHRFSTGLTLLDLALAPIVTYDVIDHVWGVDVPVYFMPDADGNLTGGIRFGYRSDRANEFTIGAFVGTAFDIFGGGS
jgi:hypothetical protein